MTEVAGGEAATDADVKAAAEAALSSEDKEDTTDFEADARDMGWKPKSEWKGDPDNWKDAKTYVEHGDHINRIVEARVAKVKADADERFTRLERTTKTAVENLTAQRDKAIADLKAEKKAAIKAGDAEEVERIETEIETLKGNEIEKPGAKPAPKTQEEAEKIIQENTKAFAKANTWFVDEPDMAEFARKWAANNADINTEITFEDNAKATVEAVKRKFPAYFAKAGGNGHSPVDGGSAFGSRPGKQGKTASDLPSDVRTIGMQLVKSGAFKDIEAYAKEYHKNA